MLSIALMLALPAQAPPPLDLAALLREAERNNPEIAAALGRAAAADAVPSQRETPPDPVASVAYTNDTVTGLTLGSSEFSTLAFSWTQEVPYPGKLRLAGDAARRDADLARRRADVVRQALAARIKQKYADLYRVDRTTAILTDSRGLIVSLAETAQVRFENGEGLLQNVLKARTETTQVDLELAKLAQERRSLEVELNALAGRTQDEPLGPATSLPAAAGPIDGAALERDALARAPEILEQQAAAERDDADLALARRELKPDLMWGAAYQNRGGLDPMVMGMFGVRLPLHRDRRQARAVAQAESTLQASRQDLAAARLRAAAAVRDLVARSDRAATLERLYHDAVLPQARSAFESSSASYSSGRVDFLTVLTDLKTLLDYQVDVETQRAEGFAALAELERITGADLAPAGAGQPGSGQPGAAGPGAAGPAATGTAAEVKP